MLSSIPFYCTPRFVILALWISKVLETTGFLPAQSLLIRLLGGIVYLAFRAQHRYHFPREVFLDLCMFSQVSSSIHVFIKSCVCPVIL